MIDEFHTIDIGNGGITQNGPGRVLTAKERER